MKRLIPAAALLALSVSLTACSLAPRYQRPAPPVASQWPIAAPVSGARVAWRDLFLDPALQKTIAAALANNRNLRVAALDIEKARAQYGIERAGLFPAISGEAGGDKSHSDASGDSESYSADLGLTWELDLFGRVRSLKDAAVDQFFAARENRNAVAIALIADTATAWLDLAADEDDLAVSQQTYAARQDAYAIVAGQARIGTVSDLELNQALTEQEQARADAAAAATRVDEDRAALTLLVGDSLTGDMLPAGLRPGQVADSLPVGVPSDVLLKRPDVLAAEDQLKAANADIGAARAAFFPSISLTGQTGSASDALGSLFSSGTGVWSYGARLNVPVFAGGANLLGLKAARASRDIAVAQYEGAIQSAFSDVSQGLAVRARIDERLDAQTRATHAALASLTLSQARYGAGADSYLVLLDAERTAYSAQQALIALQATKATNIADLYRALGNDESL